MNVSNKDLLNAALKAILAAGEHHWLGKLTGTFVSEVAEAWEELPEEQRSSLEAADGDDVAASLRSADLAPRRAALSGIESGELAELADGLQSELDAHLADLEDGLRD